MVFPLTTLALTSSINGSNRHGTGTHVLFQVSLAFTPRCQHLLALDLNVRHLQRRCYNCAPSAQIYDMLDECKNGSQRNIGKTLKKNNGLRYAFTNR